MRALFKNRNFSLLFTGTFVSLIGTAFYNFAVGWYLLSLTQSPLIAGLYITIGALVQIAATPLAGVFVDRLHKVRILYITDFIRGVTVLLGGFVLFALTDTALIVTLLYVLTVILALNNAFFQPATAAIRPDIVEDNALNQANAMFSFINSVQAIVGVLAAGILYGILGIELIFIVNGVSFLLSGISEMFITMPHPKQARAQTPPRVVEDLKEGFRYMASKHGLLTFMFAALLMNFAIAPVFANGMPYLFNVLLEKEPIHLAMTHVTFSSGMLVGGLLVGMVGAKLAIGKCIRVSITFTTLGMTVAGVCMYLVAQGSLTYPTFLMVFLPVMFFSALANVFLNVPFMTGVMRAVEPSVRGRVMAILETLSGAMMPLSFALAGVILQFGSIGALLIGAFALVLIPYTMMMFAPPTQRFLRTLG